MIAFLDRVMRGRFFVMLFTRSDKRLKRPSVTRSAVLRG